eukprot:CAMPEP_0172449596 /NCGR_PEP_ID=MMETSP1065-20121228/8264_1 /TAXON_ID=265537 /ORGANISM="Amphiprora paludosa, Strain CCMP125" /LENGTH=114 /DNA_ID=CAMNT_0013201299 /DNA_START=71 /DNA_END=415 /DNA_ORIENTATION=-
MSVPQAPALSLVDTTETSIALKFTPLDDLTLQYELEWKEYPAPSYTNSKKGISAEDAKSVMAEPLEPGKTYCVRLVAVDGSGNKGEPCKEMVLDTEQVGCTPKPDGGGGCCTIL